MVTFFPKRGEFIRLNFNPQSGHEQMGSRPALVLSQTSFNRKMGFVFVCPVSNTKRKSPFHVKIPEGEKVSGVIMADQLRSLDYRARRAVCIGKCSEVLFQEVLMHLEPILF